MFKIPANETIQTFETMFLILFATGLLSTLTYLEFQFPNIGVTIMGIALLLLFLAQRIRKKSEKIISKPVNGS